MGRLKNDGRGRLGGRTVGSKNKPAEPLNDWVTRVVNRRRAQFEKDLDEMEPKTRALILSRLFDYVV